MTRIARRAAMPGFLVLAGLGLGWGLLACGGAELEGGLPLVSIDECEQMEGTPLFDPDDERPAAMSCPEGLEAIAELDEDFYGSEGGICCTGPDDGRASRAVHTGTR